MGKKKEREKEREREREREREKEREREIQREYMKRQCRGVGQKKPFRYAIRLEAKRA